MVEIKIDQYEARLLVLSHNYGQPVTERETENSSDIARYLSVHSIVSREVLSLMVRRPV